jgi:hypothetical protein
VYSCPVYCDTSNIIELNWCYETLCSHYFYHIALTVNIIPALPTLEDFNEEWMRKGHCQTPLCSTKVSSHCGQGHFLATKHKVHSMVVFIFRNAGFLTWFYMSTVLFKHVCEPDRNNTHEILTEEI